MSHETEDNSQRTFKTNEPLVTFFYLLLRDTLPFGEVEQLVAEAEKTNGKTNHLSNAQMGYYAKRLAGRLNKK